MAGGDGNLHMAGDVGNRVIRGTRGLPWWRRIIVRLGNLFR
jgi:hypothetical protein